MPDFAREVCGTTCTFAESFVAVGRPVQILPFRRSTKKCPHLPSSDTRPDRPSLTYSAPDTPPQVIHRSTRASSHNTSVQTACPCSVASQSVGLDLGPGVVDFGPMSRSGPRARCRNSYGVRAVRASVTKLGRPVGIGGGPLCRKFRRDIFIRSKDIVKKRTCAG